jgi:predicted methyltransferase
MLRAVEYAHQLLRERLVPGDMAIDATAGNGHDTLFLTKLTGPGGMVFAFDVQEAAIAATRGLLEREGVVGGTWRLFHAGHETMREAIPKQWHGRVAAVVFNLGYLPGSDKSVITTAGHTLTALEASLYLLRPGGVLVIVLYSGHPGGREETEAVLKFVAGSSSREFHAIEYRTLNTRNEPPFVVAVEKAKTTRAEV